LKQEDLEESKKVIICGTSLKDNDYLNHLDKFGFVKKLDKPILGICGGMQIIGKAFGSELEKTDEIGQIRISFEKEFLGLNGEHNICSLHNHSINLSEEFEAYAKSKCVQAMKHKEKEIYATLFHPEVLNKRLIINFCLI
jgi:GMP synthase (glutamine-hydrolysing)